MTKPQQEVMELTGLELRVEAQVFADALKIVLPFTVGGATVCTGVQITGNDDGTVVLEATNLDQKVVTSFAASVGHPGVSVAPAKLIEGFVRSVTGAVELKADDNTLSVASSSSSFDMRVLPNDEWPRFSDVDGPDVDLTEAWSGVKRILHAVSKLDDKVPVRHVVRFEEGAVVAHSSRQLACYRLDSITPVQHAVNVPSGFIAMLVRAIEGPVSARFSERLVMFRSENTEWTGRVTTDAYHDWRKLLRDTSPYHIKVVRSELLSTLNRLALLPEESGFRRIHVKVDAEAGELTFTASGRDVGTIVDVIDCESDWQGEEFLMVISDLKDLADNATGDEIDLGVMGTQKHLQLDEEAWTGLFTPLADKSL